MSKPEIIKQLKNQHPKLAQSDIEIIIDAFCETIQKALVDGAKVEIRGFGTFSLHNHNSRTARNPKTGELVALEKRHSVHFKPSKELKMRVNNKI